MDQLAFQRRQLPFLNPGMWSVVQNCFFKKARKLTEFDKKAWPQISFLLE